MYTRINNYYEWKNLEIPEKGRKFFHCFIENNFEFQYWVFIPTELRRDNV